MERSHVVKMLAEAELFTNLDTAALEVVAERTQVRTYRTGSTLFFEGDTGDAFYVLAEGTVKVYVSSGHGQEMVLATLRPPDTVGEVSMLDGGPRSACVEALEDVTALAIPRSDFIDLVSHSPAVADALLRSGGKLLRRTTTHAADLVFLDLEGRVAKLLIEMADERGAESEGGVTLELGLTQGDLASMVGGSRQSVNQILHALEGRGFIALDGRTVSITNRDALARRGEVT